ncbi:hypothetical protein K505DRAFT_322304 [Melanomma pulvis-pyrius CBS 109.77]|uniref:F-box domain-containing protein n=1 Tax=Melanomma pulvis-pyrius CBS 109.77 TaxID=1314802 RepID=A0A6A6XMM1_9PLEO|nr:hypothetical protein K505DRAFT_322304 [Melanomma pulvis-pyrius CBS 109.77]
MLSACTRVFHTPELLEAVLAQLPRKDLLFAQRVSRHFQSSVKSSPSLQQALFFRAAPLKDPKAWIINPFLRKTFLPWFAFSRTSQDIETIELLDWTLDDKKRQAFLYKDASWRKMLVLQPPPKKLSIVEFCHGQCADSAREANISFEEKDSQSVTMDAVYDITEEHICGEQVSDFGLSILDSETGPQITLYLRFTVQCCVDDWNYFPHSLKSQSAARYTLQSVNFVKMKAKDDDSWSGRRLDMEWTTGLTQKRGGVDSNEFKKWQKTQKRQRERVLLS